MQLHSPCMYLLNGYVISLQSNIENNSHSDKHTEQRTKSGAYERKRKTRVREDSRGYRNVGKTLERQKRRHARCNQTSSCVLRARCNPEALIHQQRIEGNDRHAADKPKLLSDNSEDKVRLFLREEISILDGA